MRKKYLMAAVLAVYVGTAAAATAPAPVRVPGIPSPTAASAPSTSWQHIYGPVPEAVLSPDTSVCPGAPVILNAVMVPPPVAWVGAAPEIRFEIIRGQGWFEPFADIQKDSPGFWKRLFKRLRGGYHDRFFTAAADERTGSIGVVFYPLGEAGETIRLRARCADKNIDLGTVEYVFNVGKNRASEIKRLAAKGLKQEQSLDNINFRWHESVVVTSPSDNMLARGKVMNVERIFGNGYIDSLYEDAAVSDKNGERKPYNVESSPYVHIRYWGETSYALIGWKGDPDPPGPSGAIMLYYYNKETGLMQELRFYSVHNCGRGVFLWNQSVSGVYFNTQIQKRTWSPPTQLWEEASVIRRNIRLLEDVEMKRVP